MPRICTSPGTHHTKSHQLENCARQFSHLQVFTPLYKTLSKHKLCDKVGHDRITFYSPNFSCGPPKDQVPVQGCRGHVIVLRLQPAPWQGSPAPNLPVNPNPHVSGSNSCCWRKRSGSCVFLSSRTLKSELQDTAREEQSCCL